MAIHRALPDLATLGPSELKALILTQHEQLLSRDHEIEHLKLLIAKLWRMQFGRKSEKLERQIEQLELRLDELEASRGPSRSLLRLRQLQSVRRTEQQNPCGGRCPRTCRARRFRSRRSKLRVQTAAGS